MHLPAISMIAYLLVAGIAVAEVENDWESRNLKGCVAETATTVTTYSTDDENSVSSSITPVRFYTRIHRFNPDGYLIESIRLNENGEVVNRMVFEHDTNGNEIKRTIYEKSNQLKSITKYVYNDHDDCIESKEYDPKGNLTEQKSYERIYDDQGYEIQKKTYNENGKLVSSIEYLYDNCGNPVQTIRKDADGNIIVKRKDIYSEKGLKTESIDYVADGIDYMADGIGEQKHLYAYDNKGNRVLSAHYASGTAYPSWWTTSYVYDAQGNWIENKTLSFMSHKFRSGPELHRKYQREIKYFADDAIEQSN